MRLRKNHMAGRTIEAHKIAGAIGAEISWVDLARELAGETVAAIRRARPVYLNSRSAFISVFHTPQASGMPTNSQTRTSLTALPPS
jgi:hypothetical protein